MTQVTDRSAQQIKRGFMKYESARIFEKINDNDLVLSLGSTKNSELARPYCNDIIAFNLWDSCKAENLYKNHEDSEGKE